MKSFHQTLFSKKFVVPSVAVMMTLASTMFLTPAFAGFFLDTNLLTNADNSLTAEYRARGFAGSPPGAEVFLTSNVEVEFKCSSPNAQGKDQPETRQTRDTTIELKGESDNFSQGSTDDDVSIGPPSEEDLSAEELCKTSKLNVEVESITYTDIVLHAIPNDSNEPEVTEEFDDVGPINP